MTLRTNLSICVICPIVQFWPVPGKEKKPCKIDLSCKIVTRAKMTLLAKVTPCKIVCSCKNVPLFKSFFVQKRSSCIFVLSCKNCSVQFCALMQFCPLVQFYTFVQTWLRPIIEVCKLNILFTTLFRWKKIAISSSKIKHLWNICYNPNILIFYFGNNVLKKTKYVNNKILINLKYFYLFVVKFFVVGDCYENKFI